MSSPSSRLPPFFPSSFSSSYPPHIGFHYLDIYFPSTFVSQSALEIHLAVSTGKLTIGLGQQGLAFVNDREDVYSCALTAVSEFMNKYGIAYEDVGRLEVASETILDHSKSIKTILMQLFAASGNTDIEGIDSMNACYAGTNAVFNSLDWIESSSFDGRYALVVAADIAEYAEGPARPTGGVGVVVMALGPNAPIVVERGTRASHMENAWDFYKPNMDSPYPVVDGKFSNSCYLKSLDICYERHKNKVNKQRLVQQAQSESKEKESLSTPSVTVSNFDYVVFHAPYNKLVQKSYARLLYNDFLADPTDPSFSTIVPFQNLTRDQSYENTDLEKALVALSKSTYATRVAPSTLLPVQCGNMYTASLYAGLLSLFGSSSRSVEENLAGKRVLCFSYGSGLASSMFALRVRKEEDAVKQLKKWQQSARLEERLKERIETTCKEFEETMKLREHLHAANSFEPKGSIERLRDGTFYLVRKDEKGRRQYAVKGKEKNGTASS